MRAPLFAACVASIAAVACGGGNNSIEVSAPSAVKCQVTVSNDMAGNAPPAGATGSLAVTTTRDCTWTASSAVSWITFATDASGQGSGTIGYRVAANGDASIRRGNVDVNNTQVTIVQDPAPCTFTVTPPSVSVPSQGGTMTETVQTLAGCAWSASISVDWIRTPDHPSGNGSGAITLSVDPNAGAGRSSNIAIAGKPVTVQQAGAANTPPPPPAPGPTEPPPTSCTYAIGSSSENVGPDNATIIVAVTTRSDCSWTATSHASWITVASGASGHGDGTVMLRVADNSGASRSGTVTVAGRTFTVNQAAASSPPPPCTWSIAPTSQNVTDAGGSGSTTVTASAATCAWSATSNSDWITLVSGASGVGNGTVSFNVAPNTGAARTGTLTVAGQTFTISQAAPPPPCTLSISPTSVTAPAEGLTGTVAITASAQSCAWSATSTLDWVTFAAPASGTGSATVAFTVAPNSATARAGTVTIAGQAFSVSQAGQ